MFNRTSKMTALLVAAASITSIMPASAAERLGTKDGTITRGFAYADEHEEFSGQSVSVLWKRTYAGLDLQSE